MTYALYWHASSKNGIIVDQGFDKASDLTDAMDKIKAVLDDEKIALCHSIWYCVIDESNNIRVLDVAKNINKGVL